MLNGKVCILCCRQLPACMPCCSADPAAACPPTCLPPAIDPRRCAVHPELSSPLREGEASHHALYAGLTSLNTVRAEGRQEGVCLSNRKPPSRPSLQA